MKDYIDREASKYQSAQRKQQSGGKVIEYKTILKEWNGYKIRKMINQWMLSGEEKRKFWKILGK